MSKKIIITVFMMCVLTLTLGTNVFANGTILNAGPNGVVTPPTKGENDLGNLPAVAGEIWSTVALLVQILSIGCVVFAGLRYMWASPDKKADIKKSVIYLMVGAIFVFCSTTIAQFVINYANDTINVITK